MSVRTFSADEISGFTFTPTDGGFNTDNWVRSATLWNNVIASITAATSGAVPRSKNSFLQIVLEGDWDFASFPALPADAQITNVRLRYAAACTQDASSTNASAVLNSCTAQTDMTLDDTSGNPNIFKPMAGSDSNVGNASATATLDEEETLTTSNQEFDFSGSPLDLASFTALFEHLEWTITLGVGAESLGGTTGTANISGNFEITAIEIIVTYTGGGFSWEIENPGTPIKVGEKVKIVSTGDDPNGGLNGVIGVEFDTGGPSCIVPLIDFFFQSPTELIVYAPTCMHSFTGTVTVRVIGDGTVFSGSVTVGTLTVLFADGSGIYTIQKGKTSDTLYAPARDGTTTEVKIQDPYARTGYVGG